MLWELLMYVFLPLAVLVIIRKWRRITRRRRIRDENGNSVRQGFRSDIVLITGAAQGIGKELAYKFGERGAKLVLWDIDEPKLQSTRQELEDTGYDAFAYTVNCGDKDAVLATAAKVKEEVGDVTVLVNNAGTYAGKTILQMEDDDLENTMKVNVMAHFWTIRAFLPSMLEKNHGYIVALSSAAAFIPFPYLIDYSASKAALVNFMKILQFEIMLAKKLGVSVTCVCPGSVNTGFLKRFKLPGTQGRKKYERHLTVEAAARRIIRAVVKREFVVVFPQRISIISFFMSVMPNSWLKRLARRVSKKFPEIDLATGKEKY